ncbi:MAG: ferritin-like domain-containing protein, partial [Verrucomicrobiota bacterium]
MLKSLTDLLINELRDLYSAETQLVAALPEMEAAANDPDLKAAFRDHLEETKGHVERLDRISKILNVSLQGETCAAMKGLIEEGSEIISLDAESHV